MADLSEIVSVVDRITFKSLGVVNDINEKNNRYIGRDITHIYKIQLANQYAFIIGLDEKFNLVVPESLESKGLCKSKPISKLENNELNYLIQYCKEYFSSQDKKNTEEHVLATLQVIALLREAMKRVTGYRLSAKQIVCALNMLIIDGNSLSEVTKNVKDVHFIAFVASLHAILNYNVNVCCESLEGAEQSLQTVSTFYRFLDISSSVLSNVSLSPLESKIRYHDIQSLAYSDPENTILLLDNADRVLLDDYDLHIPISRLKDETLSHMLSVHSVALTYAEHGNIIALTNALLSKRESSELSHVYGFDIYNFQSILSKNTSEIVVEFEKPCKNSFFYRSNETSEEAQLRHVAASVDAAFQKNKPVFIICEDDARCLALYATLSLQYDKDVVSYLGEHDRLGLIIRSNAQEGSARPAIRSDTSSLPCSIGIQPKKIVIGRLSQYETLENQRESDKTLYNQGVHIIETDIFPNRLIDRIRASISRFGCLSVNLILNYNTVERRCREMNIAHYAGKSDFVRQVKDKQDQEASKTRSKKNGIYKKLPIPKRNNLQRDETDLFNSSSIHGFNEEGIYLDFTKSNDSKLKEIAFKNAINSLVSHHAMFVVKNMTSFGSEKNPDERAKIFIRDFIDCGVRLKSSKRYKDIKTELLHCIDHYADEKMRNAISDIFENSLATMCDTVDVDLFSQFSRKAGDISNLYDYVASELNGYLRPWYSLSALSEYLQSWFSSDIFRKCFQFWFSLEGLNKCFQSAYPVSEDRKLLAKDLLDKIEDLKKSPNLSELLTLINSKNKESMRIDLEKDGNRHPYSLFFHRNTTECRFRKHLQNIHSKIISYLVRSNTKIDLTEEVSYISDVLKLLILATKKPKLGSYHLVADFLEEFRLNDVNNIKNMDDLFSAEEGNCSIYDLLCNLKLRFTKETLTPAVRSFVNLLNDILTHIDSVSLYLRAEHATRSARCVA